MVDPTITQALRHEQRAREAVTNAILTYAERATMLEYDPSLKHIRTQQKRFKKYYTRLRSNHDYAMFMLKSTGYDTSAMTRFKA